MKKSKELCSLWNNEQELQTGNVKISELHEFKEHPFRVEHDMQLFELSKSIDEKGILVPLIVRPNPDGEGYEIIAGHRRKAACEWAGVDTVPVIVMQMDDAEATIAMIDSNLQREHMEQFDIVLMNPPYGGNEKESVKANFPSDLRSSETADLFIDIIMFRLKKNGRCAIILPDGFLFGTDNAKVNIKKKLLSEFNLHTIVRLPHSVFAPYTSITTNILFFDNTHPTEETWFYRLDMPDGYKNFSKTKPMKLEHFGSAIEWWDNREEIEVDGFPKAKKYTVEDIENLGYNLDLCGFPHEEEEILDPMDLVREYQEKRASLNAEIDHVLEKITSMLGGN